ncbi:MAG: hypothetical protein U0798_11690 [Gemmataceae bacterium]
MAEQAPLSPNYFQLHGHGLRVTYSTTGFAGQPTFSYQDAVGAHTFTGSQIDTVKTPIGDLVTVVIRLTPDAGSTSFSILIPAIILGSTHESSPVRTEGITTLHRMSIAPQLLRGQIETYHTVTLNGSAHFVFF